MTRTAPLDETDRRSGTAPRRYVLDGRTVDVAAAAPGVHVVATPIGNLGDITLRALETLAGVDLIACEDTRVTRKLTEHFGISARLTSYHDHNAADALPKLLERLETGGAVALVSDAGTPLVSDPGYRLVVEAREAGYAVHSVPGPSAVLAALTLAGLPTDKFFFEGFLPAKSGARRARIAAIGRIPGTLVLFESGPRLGETLADLADALGAREAAVCRELTKLFEEVRRESLTGLAAHYAGDAETRGEIVIVIAPPAEDANVSADDEVDRLLRQALERATVKAAVAEVTALTGRPRRDVYQRALLLGKQDGQEHGNA